MGLLRLDVHGMLFVYHLATFVDFHQGQGHVLNLQKQRHEARKPSGWSSSSSSSHTKVFSIFVVEPRNGLSILPVATTPSIAYIAYTNNLKPELAPIQWGYRAHSTTPSYRRLNLGLKPNRPPGSTHSPAEKR